MVTSVVFRGDLTNDSDTVDVVPPHSSPSFSPTPSSSPSPAPRWFGVQALRRLTHSGGNTSASLGRGPGLGDGETWDREAVVKTGDGNVTTTLLSPGFRLGPGSTSTRTHHNRNVCLSSQVSLPDPDAVRRPRCEVPFTIIGNEALGRSSYQ